MERRHYNKAAVRLPVARTARLTRRTRHCESVWEVVWDLGAWVACAFVLGMVVWDGLTAVLYQM